ncbi:V-set and immunoglobulin domain-containing protein 4-like isoform X3 [Heliangelus exortis]|uniref:V-set and immunoglobulin domain-containing protein 4-like isoform X3 n=1 Tax=Heliangelus exortis TaxID=472823 RepID=UPI003A8EC254
MGVLVRAAVLMSPLLLCNVSFSVIPVAFLDLTGSNEIKSIWKGSTTLPCVYVPVKNFVLETLIWTAVHDQSSRAIFRRDGSGDHVLLSEYRGRISVLKDTPGNLSLHILNLEISDRGTYTCQVTWRASNNSLVAREITTKLEVVKVPVTKPIIRAGELGLTVPAGARTSLTCVASGSPPIRYRWFRGAPGETALPLGSQAELVWDSLQPSDTGTYFCQAENRAGSGAVQQSDPVQLTVSDLSTVMVTSQRDVGITGIHHPTTDLPVAVVTPESGVGYPEKNYTTQTQVYEVKFHNLRAAASSRYESTGHYEDPIPCADDNYVMEPLKSKECEEINKKNNEYECLGNTQESVYELGDTV